MADILVAAIIAAVIGAFSHPYADYDFYGTWVRAPWFIYLVPYLLLNGLSGWLGWFVAKRVHWLPGRSLGLRALGYALLGQALIRAQLKKLPVDSADDVVGVLQLFSRWNRGMLDTQVKKSVTKVVTSLEPKPLGTYVMAIMDREVAKDENLSLEVRKFLAGRIKSRIDALSGGSEQAKTELQGQAIDWVIQYKFFAPKLIAPGS